MATEEGIAQVVSVIGTYVEEFLPAYRSGRPVGEYLDTLIVYKVLCSHDGTIRKRPLITYAVESGVAKAGSSVLRVVDAVRAGSPERYASFRELASATSVKHSYTTWLNVPEYAVERLADVANSFGAQGCSAFTYDELLACFSAAVPDLNPEVAHREYSRTTNNLRIVLRNDGLLRRGRRALLVGASAVVR